jgi:hypothetical protein
MKRFFQFFIALAAVLWAGTGMASQTRVVINLSEQKAYLIKQGKVILVSPISSGRRGWSTPTGHFRVFSKDIDHRSGSFGSVIDAAGRVINSNATPGSHVPRGGHFQPAPMRTTWNSARRLGCTAVIFLGTLRPMGAYGCRGS